MSFKGAVDSVLKDFMMTQTTINLKQAEIKKEEIEAIREEQMKEQYS